MNKQFKEVSKDEFDAFIQNYYEPLVKDVYGIIDPPLLTYNDFSNGKTWPYSIVARVVLYESFPMERKGKIYGWAPNKYYINI